MTKPATVNVTVIDLETGESEQTRIINILNPKSANWLRNVIIYSANNRKKIEIIHIDDKNAIDNENETT